jgi:hypothetical protein
MRILQALLSVLLSVVQLQGKSSSGKLSLLHDDNDDNDSSVAVVAEDEDEKARQR